MLYSHNQLYIHIYMQKHNDAITTSRLSSLEKYTSHFIEGVVCERWVGDWTNTATYWPPPTLPTIAVRLFRSPGLLNRGAWGPSLSADSWFPQLDLEHWLQALSSNCMTSCLTPCYIIVLRPLNSTCRQPRPPSDLFDRIHLLFTQVHFFFWQLGRVGSQYTTIRQPVKKKEYSEFKPNVLWLKIYHRSFSTRG